MKNPNLPFVFKIVASQRGPGVFAAGPGSAHSPVLHRRSSSTGTTSASLTHTASPVLGIEWVVLDLHEFIMHLLNCCLSFCFWSRACCVGVHELCFRGGEGWAVLSDLFWWIWRCLICSWVKHTSGAAALLHSCCQQAFNSGGSSWREMLPWVVAELRGSQKMILVFPWKGLLPSWDRHSER